MTEKTCLSATGLVPVTPQVLAILGQALRLLAVDPGLLPADRIALTLTAVGGGNAPQAAPTVADTRRVATHLLDGVMDSAAIAVTRFRHVQAPGIDTLSVSLPADCYRAMTLPTLRWLQRIGAVNGRFRP